MYVTVGDTEIFCTIAGSGAPCLIPSLAGTPIYERTFTPALGGVFELCRDMVASIVVREGQWGEQ